MDQESTGVLLQALVFAAHKHRDQRRKGTDQAPYINHLIEVTDLLWRVGGVRDQNLLAAAVLHDSIEDTQTTPDEIRAKFGQAVADLVQEVTDDKQLPKPERKRLQVEHARSKSPQAKQLKIADKISNVGDMRKYPPADWSQERVQEYLDWARQVVEGLRGVNPALEAEFDRLYE
jgi:GTP diphosphokinase / guanosine-3',5'-bis(diphosphate) 3'-diphosphatase